MTEPETTDAATPTIEEVSRVGASSGENSRMAEQLRGLSTEQLSELTQLCQEASGPTEEEEEEEEEGAVPVLV